MADIVYRDDLQGVMPAAPWMAPPAMHEVRAFCGLVDDTRDAQRLFQPAGYHQVGIHFLTTIATELDLELPIPDVMLLVVACKESGSFNLSA